MTAYVSPTGKYLATASSMWSFSGADLQRWPAGKSEPKRVMRRPRAGIHGWKDWFRFFWGEMTHTVDAFTIDEPAATLERSGPVLATARRDGAMEFFDLGRQARLLKIPGPTERSPGTAGHDKAPTALTFDGSGLTRRAAVQGEKCSSGSCRRIAPPGGSSTPRGRCLQCRACAGAANRRFLGHAASERAGILEVTHGEPRRTPRGRS